MKKITALILLAVIMTIGGVFATWTYAQGSIAQKNVYIKSQIKMGEISNSNAKGTIDVDLTSVSVIVDDTDDTDTTGDHHAVLKVSGTITFNFTPAKGADENISTNGIAMRYKVALTDTTVTYPDVNGEDKNPIVVASNEWVNLNSGVATKSVTINASELGLSLGGDFYLPTYEDFTAFQQKLNSLSIMITVEEIPVGA